MLICKLLHQKADKSVKQYFVVMRKPLKNSVLILKAKNHCLRFLTFFFFYFISKIAFVVKVTNNLLKFYFWVKILQNGPKLSKNPSKFYFCKTCQKVTNNLSKFYFWVKKLQNGPKSDKQSIEILFLG